MAATTTTMAPTTTANPEPTAAELAVAEAFGAAYNSYDFEAMRAVFAAGQPQFEATVGRDTDTWTAEEIQKELAFAAVVGDSWDLESCKKEFGRVTCRFAAADALTHRLGLDPAIVNISFNEADGKLVDGTTNLVAGFTVYDHAMHEYGHWYEETYPGQGSIQGFHHRGWNVEDPDAAALFMKHLDEWAASTGQ